MKTESIHYQADGLDMIGHLAWDETVSGKRPAVLVFPEAFGLGEHAKSRAERIAKELGYVALACDLHGGQTLVTELEKGDAAAATAAQRAGQGARPHGRTHWPP